MGEANGGGGPDLTEGVALERIPAGGVLAGHVGGEAVLLYREGDRVSAVSGTCTHYSGPLGDGVVVDGTVRCPWHHACFSLRTGEVLRAPALQPLARWEVVEEGGRVRVTSKEEPEPPGALPSDAASSRRLVIVGFGAAGASAVEWLLRDGWEGTIDVVDPDPDAPYDRPNLSKDYLAGHASEDWIPLRPRGWYEERGVRVHRVAASRLDAASHRLTLGDGSELSYDGLLLATGATPVRLPLGAGAGEDATASLPPVHYLRSLADCRSLIAAAESARSVVVIGASFIGLEVAASLRSRDLQVDVVAPESVPLERVLGTELGREIRRIHEEHGVTFHLGRTVGSLERGGVVLDDGTSLAGDLVVVGVGVRPALDLAAGARLAVDGGVLVDERLRTSAEGVWAAGDIARYPDARTGERIRIEHWVVAERQGASAAADMAGRGSAFTDVPFFWTQHYDVPVNYVGHAGRWDEVAVERDPAAGSWAVAYRAGGRTLAVATINRDAESLAAELEMEGETTKGEAHVQA